MKQNNEEPNVYEVILDYLDTPIIKTQDQNYWTEYYKKELNLRIEQKKEFIKKLKETQDIKVIIELINNYERVNLK